MDEWILAQIGDLELIRRSLLRDLTKLHERVAELERENESLKQELLERKDG